MKLAGNHKAPVFLATAEANDEEMRQRIGRHKTERDPRFITVEKPLDPASAFYDLKPDIDLVLLDCITVWLSNLLHYYGEKTENAREIEALMDILSTPRCDIIVVTNETGLGIVPMNSVARRFRDLTGSVNQRIAEKANTVIMTVCGIPLTIK